MNDWFTQFNLALKNSNISQAQEICIESTWQDSETIYSKNLYNKLQRQGLNLEEVETLRYLNRTVSCANVIKDGQVVDTIYLNFETDNKDLLGSWDSSKKGCLAYLDGLLPLVFHYRLYTKTIKTADAFKELIITHNITSKIRGCYEIYDTQKLELIATDINHPPKVILDTTIFQLMDQFEGFEVESSIFVETIHRGMVKLTHPNEGDLYVNMEYFDEWKIIGGGCVALTNSLIDDFNFSQNFIKELS